MESAITSEATPAVTPITEMTVITPITAWRRLARRYRAATKSSNFMPPSHATVEGSCRDPLKGQRDQGHAFLVLKETLPKSFFQFVFLNPDHQRKGDERADGEQNKACNKAASQRPGRHVQQMSEINWMAHARVQSSRY